MSLGREGPPRPPPALVALKRVISPLSLGVTHEKSVEGSGIFWVSFLDVAEGLCIPNLRFEKLKCQCP